MGCSDSESHAVDFGFHVSATWIPDSNSEWDSGFLGTGQDSASHKLKFPRFLILRAKLFLKFRNPDSLAWGNMKVSLFLAKQKPDQEKILIN